VVTFEEAEKELDASGTGMGEFQRMFSGLSRGRFGAAVAAASSRRFLTLTGPWLCFVGFAVATTPSSQRMRLFN
jgi:hypothetical protein